MGCIQAWLLVGLSLTRGPRRFAVYTTQPGNNRKNNFSCVYGAANSKRGEQCCALDRRCLEQAYTYLRSEITEDPAWRCASGTQRSGSAPIQVLHRALAS